MRIEIGPGDRPLQGFVRVGHPASPGGVDIACDARRIPLPDGSCELVYSSHCIEHIEWHEVEDTIREWARVVAQGGALEVHTVNAGKLMKYLVEWTPQSPLRKAIWRKLARNRSYESLVAPLLNPRTDPERPDGPEDAWFMHRALITDVYLRHCFSLAGLVCEVRAPVPRGDTSGLNRDWFNLGVRGVKP